MFLESFLIFIFVDAEGVFAPRHGIVLALQRLFLRVCMLLVKVVRESGS